METKKPLRHRLWLFWFKNERGLKRGLLALTGILLLALIFILTPEKKPAEAGLFETAFARQIVFGRVLGASATFDTSWTLDEARYRQSPNLRVMVKYTGVSGTVTVTFYNSPNNTDWWASRYLNTDSVATTTTPVVTSTVGGNRRIHYTFDEPLAAYHRLKIVTAVTSGATFDVWVLYR